MHTQVEQYSQKGYSAVYKNTTNYYGILYYCDMVKGLQLVSPIDVIINVHTIMKFRVIC